MLKLLGNSNQSGALLQIIVQATSSRAELKSFLIKTI